MSSETYSSLLTGLGRLLDTARRQAARAVNTVLTSTYWEIGRRIVKFEQKGHVRAAYGETLLKRLSSDLTKRFGRGFSKSNIEQMRLFHLTYPKPIAQTLSGQLLPPLISETLSTKSSPSPICRTVSSKSSLIWQTPSAKSARKPIPQTVSGKLLPPPIVQTLSAQSEIPKFPLSWSHYCLLLSLDDTARAFYESEAVRGGWSVRQLDRQISSQYFERTALSKNKTAMLSKGAKAGPGDRISPEQEIKDPYVLEFLDLKDEYSESELEEALTRHLEWFLLEMGGEFAFIARQKRLRVGDAWYRIDLMLYHRRLRCLILVDLKLGRLTHADAGQMHLYLNYAREHWVLPGENPPVGLILCAKKDEAVAHYALEGLANRVLTSEYKTVLPDAARLEAEIRKTQAALQARLSIKRTGHDL